MLWYRWNNRAELTLLKQMCPFIMRSGCRIIVYVRGWRHLRSHGALLQFSHTVGELHINAFKNSHKRIFVITHPGMIICCYVACYICLLMLWTLVFAFSLSLSVMSVKESLYNCEDAAVWRAVHGKYWTVVEARSAVKGRTSGRLLQLDRWFEFLQAHTKNLFLCSLLHLYINNNDINDKLLKFINLK